MLQLKEKVCLNEYKSKTHIYAIYKRRTSDLKITYRLKKEVQYSDKIDEEGQYIMIKVSTQEDKTIINIYVPNTGSPHYIRQILTDMKNKQ